MSKTILSINPEEYFVDYSMQEFLRRATLKVKIYDRGAPPFTSYDWGNFDVIVNSLRKAMKWDESGVISVRVFYEPEYFTRNIETPDLLDPLHTVFVKKYQGFKE